MNPFALIDLGAEYNSVMAEIEANDGELTPELEARHDEIVVRLAGSAVNVVTALRLISAGEADLDEWIAKLERRKASLRKETERWKTAALRGMEGAGINRLEGEINGVPVKVGIMQSESVEITGEVPASYSREIPARREPDKVMIKKALKDGADVPGAELRTSSYLRVWA